MEEVDEEEAAPLLLPDDVEGADAEFMELEEFLPEKDDMNVDGTPVTTVQQLLKETGMPFIVLHHDKADETAMAMQYVNTGVSCVMHAVFDAAVMAYLADDVCDKDMLIALVLAARTPRMYDVIGGPGAGDCPSNLRSRCMLYCQEFNAFIACMDREGQLHAWYNQRDGTPFTWIFAACAVRYMGEGRKTLSKENILHHMRMDGVLTAQRELQVTSIFNEPSLQ